MNAYLKKNIFFLVLIIGLIVFYWVRYRVAPNIEFGETKAIDQQGNELVLGDLLKQPTVLHFYARWCGPCLGELRTLKTRIDYLEAQGVRVVMVTDDAPESVASVASGLPANVAIYRVEKLTALGIHTIPTTYFINAAGETKEKIVDVCHWENDDFCNEIISKIK